MVLSYIKKSELDYDNKSKASNESEYEWVIDTVR